MRKRAGSGHQLRATAIEAKETYYNSKRDLYTHIKRPIYTQDQDTNCGLLRRAPQGIVCGGTYCCERCTSNCGEVFFSFSFFLFFRVTLHKRLVCDMRTIKCGKVLFCYFSFVKMFLSIFAELMVMLGETAPTLLATPYTKLQHKKPEPQQSVCGCLWRR